MWPNPQETADLVTFTEEILNGRLHFFCAVPSTQNILIRTIVNVLKLKGSSYQRCSLKKAALKNFTVPTGNHLCWSLFLLKKQVFRTATELKRGTSTGVFPWIFRNFKKTLKNICERLGLIHYDVKRAAVSEKRRKELQHSTKRLVSYKQRNFFVHLKKKRNNIKKKRKKKSKATKTKSKEILQQQSPGFVLVVLGGIVLLLVFFVAGAALVFVVAKRKSIGDFIFILCSHRLWVLYTLLDSAFHK